MIFTDTIKHPSPHAIEQPNGGLQIAVSVNGKRVATVDSWAQVKAFRPPQRGRCLLSRTFFSKTLPREKVMTKHTYALATVTGELIR